MRLSRLSLATLLASTWIALACGGIPGGGGEDADGAVSEADPVAAADTPEDAAAVEAAEPEPETQAADDAPKEAVAAAKPEANSEQGTILEHLGIPVGNGIVGESTDKSAQIVYRSAFAVQKTWTLYTDSLEANGWVRKNTTVPPYESLYDKEREVLDLRMRMGGTSVIVDIKLRRR